MDDVTLSQMKPNDTPAQQDLTIPSATPESTPESIPESVCPECGGAMHVYWQPGFGPVRGLWYATCWNKAGDCRIEGVTLELGAHERLSEAQREQYASTRRGAEARAKLDQARCLLAARTYVEKHPLKKPA